MGDIQLGFCNPTTLHTICFEQFTGGDVIVRKPTHLDQGIIEHWILFDNGIFGRIGYDFVVHLTSWIQSTLQEIRHFQLTWIQSGSESIWGTLCCNAGG